MGPSFFLTQKRIFVRHGYEQKTKNLYRSGGITLDSGLT